MKRRELIKKLEAMGCEFVRHGGSHDIYKQPTTGVQEPIPRHREIVERLAKKILKKMKQEGD